MKILINYQESTTILHFGMVELTPEQFENIKPANGKVMNNDVLTQAEETALIIIDMLMYTGNNREEMYANIDKDPDIEPVVREFFGIKATPVTDFENLVNLSQYDALLSCGWI